MQTTAQRPALAALTLGALGVVFGDIGTSPLYAVTTCFDTSKGLPITEPNVLGILSLIFWSLMIVVSAKFATLIMHADNNGEGGIMALLTLNMRNKSFSRRTRLVLVSIGLFGAALFFGDGIITPAISVLSAVEGLKVAAPGLTPLVLPITIGVLISLFLLQRKGSGIMGQWFGPVMLGWFLTIGALGLNSVIQHPSILKMMNPYWAYLFVHDHVYIAFIVMGAVVLTTTGAEALYADMGHFGRIPIQWAWFLVVFPALVLNYAGQGALILHNPAAVENSFYLLVPKLNQYPNLLLYMLIGLSTVATVIASQSVISGVFSMARQAMQLGYLPRLTVSHTSESEIGQIYVPEINWLLMILVIALVLMFKSSASLAAAYGIAVTITMLCDTLLVSCVIYRLWNWPLWVMLMIAIPLLIPDLIFLSSTSLKIADGGWFPLLIGVVAFIVMMTWKRGRQLLLAKLHRETLPLDLFINSVTSTAHTVDGTAVFMTASQLLVPHALLHNLKHNKVLHKTNILMTVQTEDVPYIDDEKRVTVERLNDRFFRVIARYGFKEQPDVPSAIKVGCKLLDLSFDMMNISFFVSRERILHSVGDGMASWREKLFISMSRNTTSASDFFQIPPNRVVEMGSQIEI